MEKYVAAIDQGTTSTRCMVFDRGGRVVARAQEEHRQIFPRPGWVEHDALEIWSRTQAVMRAALGQVPGGAEIGAGRIAALGITNQRETTVVWERATGQPVCNAIVWQDTRTDNICQDLARASGPGRFLSQTGLPLATYFSGPKLMWILDNVPNARSRAEKGELLFGTVDTWLLWNLTGRHLTDVTNASRTMLMNLETLDWDEEILRELRIPRQMLPEIRSSSEMLGETVGLQSEPYVGLPVASDLGDQQAALVGQCCFEIGDAKNTYGTGCFMLLNTGHSPVRSKAGLLTTLGYKLGTQKAVYALEGSVAIAGALVQWIRDNLGLVHSSEEIEALAARVDDNGGVYLVPAFSGLFAPHWRSDARGIIVGLTRFTNAAHIARAALEATAFQSREVLDAMLADSGVRLASLKVDGGMVSNNLLMQFQADILGVPVACPQVLETTALGAAYAAGLAVGIWDGLKDLSSNWTVGKEWRPSMEDARRNELYAWWKKAVSRSLDWAV